MGYGFLIKDFIKVINLTVFISTCFKTSNFYRCHIEKCGHWVMQEKPKEFNDCLIGWLRKISTSSKL